MRGIQPKEAGPLSGLSSGEIDAIADAVYERAKQQFPQMSLVQVVSVSPTEPRTLTVRKRPGEDEVPVVARQTDPAAIPSAGEWLTALSVPGGLVVLSSTEGTQAELPPPDSATEDAPGIVEYADPLEAAAGQRLDRAMSAKRTMDVIVGRPGAKLLTDYTSLQAAFDAIPAGGALLVPPGTYTHSGAATRTQKGITIRGYGPEQSRLVFTGTTGGLNMRPLNAGQTVYIEDLSVLTDTAGGGTAINLTYDNPTAWLSEMGRIQNVEIKGVDESVDYWNIGIDTYDCWGVRIINPSIRGKVRTFDMLYAIRNGGYMSETTVHNARIFHAEQAVRLTDKAEGAMFTNCRAVYVRDGFRLDTDQSRPGCYFTDCHANAFRYGFYINNRIRSTLKGCIAFKRDESTEDYTGITLTSGVDYPGADATIEGCMVRGQGGLGGTQDTGIRVGNFSNAIILGTMNITGCYRGIHLTGLASNCMVDYTNFTNIGSANILDQGTNNKIGPHNY